MYIPRKLRTVFKQALQQFPAVLITGPRQSGKTTFVQNELPDIAYVTFDDPLNRDFALQDPEGFLHQFEKLPVVLDEIQYVPEILQHIKMRIDSKKQPGKWVLTGSQQFHLMKNVSDTLAGRIAILDLPPFSITEAKDTPEELGAILWKGLFPEPHLYPNIRDLWIKSYIQTYMERDVRQIENIRNFRAFELFINLSAAYHAQEFHPSDLARDCGVSQPTIKTWAKTLETSFLAVMLPPFFKNFGKRLIKSPKFYYSDPSIVCYLTRQPSADAALAGNMGRALFEGLMVCEAWKFFTNKGLSPSVYFWRSHGGIEIDLIIQSQGLYWPIELKLTASPTPAHTRNLNHFKELARNESAATGLIVCQVKKQTTLPRNNIALPWWQFPRWMDEKF